MGLLDTIAPRRGPKQRRLTVVFLAKTGFYVSAAAAAIFVLGSVLLYESDRELTPIPATRNSFEVIDEVQLYLQIATHRGFLNQDEPASCWDVFADKEFSAEYLKYGAWQINAFYNRVRYYWRVDDKTMAVTVDGWLKTHTPTINC